jgi:hypothetical protein
MLFFTSSEACLVETMAWGYDDTPNYQTAIGYITVNGVVWLTTPFTPVDYSRRGFNTVELHLDDCSVRNIRHFDTYGPDSTSLASYINDLPTFTVLVGVTADDAQSRLQQAAQDALFAIGVNVTHLSFRGKVAFVAQVGQPSAAVMNLAGPYGNNVKLNVIVSRKYDLLFIIA